MGEQLKELYDSLLTIETKGQSTITMVKCLSKVEQLYVAIRRAEAAAQTTATEPSVEEEE